MLYPLSYEGLPAVLPSLSCGLTATLTAEGLDERGVCSSAPGRGGHSCAVTAEPILASTSEAGEKLKVGRCDMTDAPRAPANWYADPTGRHEQRFWDGEGAGRSMSRMAARLQSTTACRRRRTEREKAPAKLAVALGGSSVAQTAVAGATSASEARDDILPPSEIPTEFGGAYHRDTCSRLGIGGCGRCTCCRCTRLLLGQNGALR